MVADGDRYVEGAREREEKASFVSYGAPLSRVNPTKLYDKIQHPCSPLTWWVTLGYPGPKPIRADGSGVVSRLEVALHVDHLVVWH